MQWSVRQNNLHKGVLFHYGVPGMRWGVRKGKDYSKKKDTYRQKAIKTKMQQRADTLMRDYKSKRIDVVLNPSYAKSGKGDKYIYMVRDKNNLDASSAIYFSPEEAQEMVNEATKLPGKLDKLSQKVSIDAVDRKYRQYQKEKNKEELKKVVKKVTKAVKKAVGAAVATIKSYISSGASFIKSLFSKN